MRKQSISFTRLISLGFHFRNGGAYWKGGGLDGIGVLIKNTHVRGACIKRGRVLEGAW